MGRREPRHGPEHASSIEVAKLALACKVVVTLNVSVESSKLTVEATFVDGSTAASVVLPAGATLGMVRDALSRQYQLVSPGGEVLESQNDEDDFVQLLKLRPA